MNIHKSFQSSNQFYRAVRKAWEFPPIVLEWRKQVVAVEEGKEVGIS
jgi:hypothetical protein